jgi:hypothetical protein
MSSPSANELTKQQAEAVARALDIGLEAPVCLACLSFVSMAVDQGDPEEIAAQVRWVTPDLWLEGLAGPALAAARRAVVAGVADADRALAELELHGGRSTVAQALVLRLGEELSRRARADVVRWAAIGARPGGTRPELN